MEPETRGNRSTVSNDPDRYITLDCIEKPSRYSPAGDIDLPGAERGDGFSCGVEEGIGGLDALLLEISLTLRNIQDELAR